MNLTIKVDGLADVKAMFRQLGEDADHALRLSTNMLGEKAQFDMRRTLDSRFSFRGTATQFKKAVVFQEAKQKKARSIQAVLRVGSDFGGTKASATFNLGRLLARHEEADSRTESGQVFFDGRGRAMTGLGFFLPAKGLRTSSANPPRKYYPSSIGAALRKTPDSRLILAKGTRKGTKKTGTGESFFATRDGIFRRRHTGFGGRVDVEALWWFRRTIRTPARLGLWETAQEVFDRFAVSYAIQAIDQVIKRSTT